MGRAAVLAVVLAMTACVKRPPVVFGERMPAGCTTEAKSEKCVGWLIDRVLMAVVFRPFDHTEITAYIEEVGNRVARASGERRTWIFRVLESSEPQAFASYGNTVYLARGTLGVLRNEAELAAVLAHEIGHTLAGHVELERDHKVSPSTSAETRMYRDAKDDEIQADELAAKLIARAGYDARAVESMLSALGANDVEDDDPSDERHPRWQERLARARDLAARYRGGELATARYNQRVASLVVGEDPRAAAVVDGAAVFARAGLAVELPPNRAIWHSGGSVTVLLSDGAMADLRLVESKLVRFLPGNQPDDPSVHTERRLAGKVALAVTVAGRDAPRRARELLATVRAPRPDEVARLRPAYFDPTVPRSVWAPPRRVPPPADAKLVRRGMPWSSRGSTGR